MRVNIIIARRHKDSDGIMMIMARSKLSALENDDGHTFNTKTNTAGMIIYELSSSMNLRKFPTQKSTMRRSRDEGLRFDANDSGSAASKRFSEGLVALAQAQRLITTDTSTIAVAHVNNKNMGMTKIKGSTQEPGHNMQFSLAFESKTAVNDPF
jgi:hypothetical protein